MTRWRVLEVESDERNDEADGDDGTGDCAKKQRFPPAPFTHDFAWLLVSSGRAATWCIYAIDTSLPHIERKYTGIKTSGGE